MAKAIQFLMPICVLLATSCIDKQDTELEKPTIQLVSPLPCDTLYFGEVFQFTAQLSDNVGLGNISMDVHHNFGHHDHGAHEPCSKDAKKDPVLPYLENWIFSLNKSNHSIVFDTLLKLPVNKGKGGLYDMGDYHFHIYLTDSEGYQVFTTLDVKILN